MKKLLVLVLATSLSGCASIPLATQLTIIGAGVAAGGLAINAFHDCRADGGCKKVALPP